MIMTRHLAAAATGLSLALAPVMAVPAFAQTEGQTGRNGDRNRRSRRASDGLRRRRAPTVAERVQPELPGRVARRRPTEAAQAGRGAGSAGPAMVPTAVEEADGSTRWIEYISISEAAASGPDLGRAAIQMKAFRKRNAARPSNGAGRGILVAGGGRLRSFFVGGARGR